MKFSGLDTLVSNAIDLSTSLILKLDDIHVVKAKRLAVNDEMGFNLQTKRFVLNDDQERTSMVEIMTSFSYAEAMFDSLAMKRSM